MGTIALLLMPPAYIEALASVTSVVLCPYSQLSCVPRSIFQRQSISHAAAVAHLRDHLIDMIKDILLHVSTHSTPFGTQF